jgi:DNA-binding NtrC family response regulator
MLHAHDRRDADRGADRLCQHRHGGRSDQAGRLASTWPSPRTPTTSRPPSATWRATPELELTNRSSSIKTLEWEHIHAVLAETDFNISEAARRLGMHRRTLARKLEKQRVNPPDHAGLCS